MKHGRSSLPFYPFYPVSTTSTHHLCPQVSRPVLIQAVALLIKCESARVLLQTVRAATRV